MIHGILPTILMGMVGALIAELVRVVPALREGKPPNGWELLASAVMVVLGAGAFLFGWDTAQPPLRVAVTGAAFPLLFSAAVSAAKPGDRSTGDVAAYGRSILDYLGGTF